VLCCAGLADHLMHLFLPALPLQLWKARSEKTRTVSLRASKGSEGKCCRRSGMMSALISSWASSCLLDAMDRWEWIS